MESQTYLAKGKNTSFYMEIDREPDEALMKAEIPGISEDLRFSELVG